MKNKIIKAIVLLLALTMFVSMVACSGDEDDNRGTIDVQATPKPVPENLMGRITLSTYKTKENDYSPTAFVQEYKAQYPGVDVNIDNQYYYETYFELLDERVASGDIGDIFMIDDSKVAKYAENDYILSLSEFTPGLINYETYMDVVPAELLFTAAYETALYNSNLYMIPVEYLNKVVFINVDHFEKAGISVPSDDWTWDDVAQIAEELKDVCEHPLSFDYKEYSIWGAFARSRGGIIYDIPDNETDINTINVTDPKVISGLVEMAMLVSNYVTGEMPDDISADELGSYGMIIGAHNDLMRWESVLTSNPDSWELAHFPRWQVEMYGNTTEYHFIGVNTTGLAVNANVVNDGEEVVKICAYLALYALIDTASEELNGNGYTVPALKSVNSQKFWRDYPVSGKNTSVFSLYSAFDFAGSLTSFLPLSAAEEFSLANVVDLYSAKYNEYLESKAGSDIDEDQLHAQAEAYALPYLQDALQEMQDAVNMNW